MNVAVKMTGRLHDEIRRDLTRPHAFAAERVGFVFGKIGTGESGKLVLLTRYHSIPDGDYIDDPTVGARLGSSAMTWAMEEVYRGRPEREGIFHIHLHNIPGETGMSRTDARDLPRMIPGFRSVGREAPHGIVILSQNHGTAWASLPGEDDRLVRCSGLSIIGAALYVFCRGARS